MFITLLAMLTVLAAIFKTEIKETYLNTITDGMFPAVPCSRIGAWGGAGLQMTRVPQIPISKGDKKFSDNPYWPKYKIGYDVDAADNVLPRGVDTGRGVQARVAPRFQNTGASPKYASSADNFRADVAVPAGRTEIGPQGGCQTSTVYSGFGQLQSSSTTTNTVGEACKPGPYDEVKEGYEDYLENQNDLPKDMCNVNLLGGDTQPVIFDRLIYSNIKSRLRGHGDPIRGDLLITPDSYKPDGGGHPGWFMPAVYPNRDLNMGAMAIIAPVGGRNEQLSLGLAQGDIGTASFGI